MIHYSPVPGMPLIKRKSLADKAFSTALCCTKFSLFKIETPFLATTAGNLVKKVGGFLSIIILLSFSAFADFSKNIDKLDKLYIRVLLES